MLDYINEAFRSLETLNEDIFATDDEGIKELSTFMNAESEDTVRVFDPDADTDEDVKPSYVGKLIVSCNVCHSLILKNKEEIELDEMSNTINSEECCPCCGECEGFTINGQISDYSATAEEKPAEEIPAEEIPVEEPEVAMSENFSLNRRSLLQHRKVEESFNNINIETDTDRLTVSSEDSGRVTVVTEPLTNAVDESGADAEMIQPVSDELADEIISQNDSSEVIEEPDEMTDVELEIDEIEEESIDELGESYLKRVYENVDSFKTSAVSNTADKIIIEGFIKFKSGVEKKTGFIFEAKTATESGKVKFVGENKHLCRGSKAFTLTGKLVENKLIGESFTYNYRAKGADGKPTRVYGTVYTSKK